MKRIAALLAATGIILLGVSQLVYRQGARDYLVPAPERVTLNFMVLLSGGRFDNARQQLDDVLAQEMGGDALPSLREALDNTLGESQFLPEGTTQGNERQVIYTARIKTQKQGMQAIEFELERNPETHQWEISSLDDLRNRVQP